MQRKSYYQEGEILDAVDFWMKSLPEAQYPTWSKLVYLSYLLHRHALIERTVSIAGNACIGKRNRLTDKNLEREVLIRSNKEYTYR